MMTPEQSLRAALLVKLRVDVEDWIATIEESVGPDEDGKCFDVFSIEDIEFQRTPVTSQRTNETEGFTFEGPLPIPMDLAREMLMWLKTRAEGELASLGVKI